MLNNKTGSAFNSGYFSSGEMSEKIYIIPPNRVRYLSEISETVRNYNKLAEEQSKIAQQMFCIRQSVDLIKSSYKNDKRTYHFLEEEYKKLEQKLDEHSRDILKNWQHKKQSLKKDYFVYKVRDKEIKVKTYSESLSHLKLPKISLPAYDNWGDILRWNLMENIPGEFPYAAGVFPFKREGEDPIRMFAGEGGPERTNKRFHYLSKGMPAIRLSTAYDSVTLYGNDPGTRPDIYGKIGNSGVSIACLDDIKKLYSGINLLDPKTSVSMTINGPAPAMVGYFMNAAIDQQCELYIRKNDLTREVEKKISKLYSLKGTERPSYQGPLPDGNDGLGLLLIGITGDKKQS